MSSLWFKIHFIFCIFFYSDCFFFELILIFHERKKSMIFNTFFISNYPMKNEKKKKRNNNYKYLCLPIECHSLLCSLKHEKKRSILFYLLRPERVNWLCQSYLVNFFFAFDIKQVFSISIMPPSVYLNKPGYINLTVGSRWLLAYKLDLIFIKLLNYLFAHV